MIVTHTHIYMYIHTSSNVFLSHMTSPNMPHLIVNVSKDIPGEGNDLLRLAVTLASKKRQEEALTKALEAQELCSAHKDVTCSSWWLVGPAGGWLVQLMVGWSFGGEVRGF